MSDGYKWAHVGGKGMTVNCTVVKIYTWMGHHVAQLTSQLVSNLRTKHLMLYRWPAIIGKWPVQAKWDRELSDCNNVCLHISLLKPHSGGQFQN